MEPDTQPIGSDFPSLPGDLLRERAEPRPWGEGALLVQTGRQALALLADELGAAGRDAIAIPAFACESMLEPFQRRGWQIVPYPVDEELRPVVESALELVRSGRASVVLTIRYFGVLPDARDQLAVRAIQGAGGYVIADETHHPFSPRAMDADASFASLRKTLPVASGAYLAWPVAPISLPDGQADGRWAAMDAFGPEAGPTPDVRAALTVANETLEADDHPRSADVRSSATLARLDFGSMAARRRDNAAALIEALADDAAIAPAVTFAPRETPSHVPLRVTEPVSLQRRLAARRIYCPIHWARPAGFATGWAWPENLISVPVDHRYSPTVMRRVADAIREEAGA